MNKWGLANLGHNGNHDLWVKLYNLSRVFKTDISTVLTVKSGLDPHRLEFQLQGEWFTVIMMSTFKRTARMRVGGRGYGGPNRIRLPTPTPPSPPPQEWVDPTESEEEDPEELVPEPSEDEPREAAGRTLGGAATRTPFGAAAEQPREEPKIQPLTPKTQNKIRMPVTHPHRTMMRTTMKPDPWSPLPTAGSTTRYPFLGCRERRRRCSTTIARITYVGTRYRHPVLPDDWDMTVEIKHPG
ncbi:hypothetical protein U9M48_008648 [Paspalum notatum var. saurae]|uniref:Uncharacterized protein n=1 Tax=Paspalum notatum var. saurae TaxID=547442 RepID=A0AAQ3SQ01_PASNO